jgi:hypothetical protein
VTLDVAIAPATPGRLGLPIARRVGRLDAFEAFLLLAFSLVSCWVLAIDLYQVLAKGRVWTGTDGLFITDQMQYLAWIQSAAHHGLVSNMFVLRGTPADYFQPCVLISGVLVALGMSPPLALLLWKPVAVLATFFGIRVFVYRSLSGTRARRVAIALGLFYGSFTVIYGQWSVIGDLFPGFLTWGYPFGLIALGAVLYGLVLHERARAEGRISIWPALLGALASSLHPWNGETLIAIVVAAELLCLRRDGFDWRRAQLATVTALGTALPLLYYLILGKADPSWGMAREASKHGFPFWSIMLVLAPIAPFAALAYGRRAAGFWEVCVRVFPFVCLAIYFFSASGASATPLHAFQGISIPLGVLAVQGLETTRWQQFRHRRIAGAACLAIATIPASAWCLKIAPTYMDPQRDNANFITRDERAALDYLHDSDVDGGVLSRGYLGLVVPGRTGRRTFVGDCLWSEPNCSRRAQVTNQLFFGQLDTWYARQFVHETGAAFVLADCRTSLTLARQLRPLIAAIHHFGCAAVYQLSTPGPPTGALA